MFPALETNQRKGKVILKTPVSITACSFVQEPMPTEAQTPSASWVSTPEMLLICNPAEGMWCWKGTDLFPPFPPVFLLLLLWLSCNLWFLHALQIESQLAQPRNKDSFYFVLSLPTRSLGQIVVVPGAPSAVFTAPSGTRRTLDGFCDQQQRNAWLLLKVQ